MPLSKVRNRDRMRKSRLHKQLNPSQESKPVQPVMPSWEEREDREWVIDADGNPIPEI